MTTPRIEEMVEKLARDIEGRLVHKLQIETISSKGQSIEYRKGLRDMRYLVMDFTREIVSTPARTALTEAHQVGRDEVVENCGKIISEIELALKNSSGSKSEIEGIIWNAHEALQDNK